MTDRISLDETTMTLEGLTSSVLSDEVRLGFTIASSQILLTCLFLEGPQSITSLARYSFHGLLVCFTVRLEILELWLWALATEEVRPGGWPFWSELVPVFASS